MRKAVILAAIVASAIAYRACSPATTRGVDVEPARVQAASSPRRGSADLLAASAASIAGIVTDDAHMPVAHARVCAIARSDNLPRSMTRDPRCVTADASGAYVLPNLLAAEYVVAAAARSYVSEMFWAVPDNAYFELHPGEAKRDINITLHAGGVEFVGTVSDLTGGPIAHAQVSRPGAGPLSVETDATGAFSLWVAPGDVQVQATADGYAYGSGEGIAPGSVAIALTPESSIAGTVVDAVTGEPVADIGVEVRDDAWADPPAELTDEQGRFVIDRLPPGRYTVLAHDAHGAGSSGSSTLLGLGQHVDGVIVKRSPGFRVEGRIVIAGSPATPCPHGRANLRLPGRSDALHLRRDATGTLSLEGVLPGRYGVDVWCAGAVSPPEVVIEVIDRDVAGQTWEVDPGATIRGRVVMRSGEPVDGAVVVENAFKTSDSGRDGHFEFDGLEPGGHQLSLINSKGVAPPNGWTVQLAERGVVELDLVLDAGGRIVGTVVDRAGAPVAPAEVYAQRERGPRAWSRADDGAGRTAADGTFSIDALPTGTYAVSVSVRGKQLHKPGAPDDAPYDRIVVHAPQASAIRLVVDAPTGTIRGRVTDAGGHPVTDAFVAAARESTSVSHAVVIGELRAQVGPRVVTGTDGSFTLAELDPGNYTVRAFRAGAGEGFAEHVATGGATTLQINPTGSIEGTVRGVTGAGIEVVLTGTQYWPHDHQTLPTGHGPFAFHDLPAGRYTIAVRTDVEEVQATVDLGESERKTGVDLDLGGGVSVTGRIIDLRTSRPVRGGSVHATVHGHISFAVTDGDGRFRVEHVPTGRALVAFWGSGLARDITTDTDLGEIGVVPDLDDLRPGHLGITWTEDAATFTIDSIDPAGPAAQSELRAGDVVTTIDGLDVRGNNHPAGETLLAAPPGTAIRLGVSRGVTATVVVAAAHD